MKTINTNDATAITTPLEEAYYNSPYYEDYLSNDLFHHSAKGCEVEMKIHRSKDGDISVDKICHTHNERCSKTGWKMGWYMGNESRGEHCQRCGCKIYRKSNAKYCKECAKIVNAEMIKEHNRMIK